MMVNITAAKQVGDVSYMVGDLATLYTIVKTERIKQSNNQEVDKRYNKKSHYVSLSRNLTAAAIRNNQRWRYGIVIDGTKLSNRYHIEPYSFSGSALESGRKLAVKELTKYDDGTYKLRLVNWPALKVAASVFEYIECLIRSQSEEFNRSHKLTIQEGGQRRINGRMIDIKYIYNVKHGDGGQLLQNTDEYPESLRYLLTKSTATNEYEERIWSESEYINIAGCIKGVIMPESKISDFETSDDNFIKLIREVLDSRMSEYDIVYY